MSLLNRSITILRKSPKQQYCPSHCITKTTSFLCTSPCSTPSPDIKNSRISFLPFLPLIQAFVTKSYHTWFAERRRQMNILSAIPCPMWQPRLMHCSLVKRGQFIRCFVAGWTVQSNSIKTKRDKAVARGEGRKEGLAICRVLFSDLNSSPLLWWSLLQLKTWLSYHNRQTWQYFRGLPLNFFSLSFFFLYNIFFYFT